MSFSYTGTTTAILYFAASFATASVVGPGTLSAASYQRLSWPGQKYGPLKISCRHSTCTPFLPASSISGTCLSNIACLIFSTGTLSSLIGLLHWMRPPTSLRGIEALLGAPPVRGGPPQARPLPAGRRPLAGHSASRGGAGWMKSPGSIHP